MGTESSTQPQRPLDWLGTKFDELQSNIERFVRGKGDVVRMSLICLLCEGHLLVEDVPGVGKTSLAKALAFSIGGHIQRIQFTPDLLPADVTGGQTWNQRTSEFEFHPGPVFANLVIADEINRASPKTQASLLEVMEEQQVTIDAAPYEVPRPFMVIATQNPIEHEGTYRLPEAQLDRFLMKINVGYPDRDSEKEIIAQRVRGETPDNVVQEVATTEEVMRMIALVRRVAINEELNDYLVSLADATRKMPDELRLGASPRGTVALALAARAHAAAAGRTYVTADDVKVLARPVLAHRMLLATSAQLRGTTIDDVLDRLLATIPVPQDRSRR